MVMNLFVKSAGGNDETEVVLIISAQSRISTAVTDATLTK